MRRGLVILIAHKQSLRRVQRSFGLGKMKDFIVKAWKDTYPDEDDHKIAFNKKIELAKQEAQKAREQREVISNMTEEQLAEMEEKIPEYKRRALILVEEDKPKEPLSVRLKRRIYLFLKETTLEEELKKEGVSLEEFKEEMDKLAEGGQMFKENISNSVSKSENIVVATTRTIIEQQNLGGTSAAISRMRKVDPDFDIFELEDDAKEIFKVTYEAFLKGDEEYLTKVSDGEARGYFLANLAKREEMQMRPKFDHIWNMDHFGLHKAAIVSSLPVFLFSVQLQEIDCHISIKEEDLETGTEVIIAGDPKNIVSNTYFVTFTLHDNPDLENVGHIWKISDFKLAENRKMLL